MRTPSAVVGFLVLCSMSLTVAQTTSRTSSIKRFNYGVSFQARGSTFANSGVWKHTFHYVLPSLSNLKPIRNWCEFHNFNRLCAEFPGLIQLMLNFSMATKTQVQTELQKAYDMIPNSPLPANFTKSKRSLLPFIGQLSSSLFGTATEEDVKLVASHVQAISKSQSELLSSFQKHTQLMSSFVSLTRDRMTNLEAAVAQQFDAVLAEIVTDRQWIKRHGSDLNFLIYSALSKIYEAIPLKNQVQNLYGGIEQLVSGILPSVFISPAAIEQTIRDIESALKNTLPNTKVLQHHPSYYYRQHDFVYIRNDTDLYITLKFPVTQEEEMILDVYNIVIFPVHFHNGSDLSTILNSETKTFFISQTFDYYAESPNQFSPRDMMPIDNLLKATPQSCLLAIFKDDSASIKTYCDFQVMNSDNFATDLYVLDFPQILIRSKQPAQLLCADYKKFLQNSSYFIYDVPCACAVKTALSFLPPRITQCDFDHRAQPEPYPQFPLNLALLQHFFSNDTLGMIKGDFLTNQSLVVQLPEMKFFNHSFDDRLAIDHSISYRLDKVVNATKAEEQIFRSMVDPLLAGDITIPSDFFFSAPGYVTITNALFAATNLVLGAYLLYKVKMINAALMMIPQQARAFTLPNLVITPSPTPTSFQFFNIPKPTDPMNGIAYLLMIILVIYIIKKICSFKKTNFISSPDFDICLEVKSRGRCFFLNLQTVPGCPSDYLTSGTNLCTHISLSGWLFPQVHIAWDDFNMVNKQSGRPVPLDINFKISWLQRFKLRYVFADSYVLLLFFSHAGKGIYVAL